MKTTTLLLLAGFTAVFSACSSTPTGSGTVDAPEVTELKDVPVAKPDPKGRKNMVLSPYYPYNIIDVKGYKSGAVAGDPSTAKRDASGKVIESTSKYFLVP